MNLFQKQQKTSGYNSIPHAIAADDETAAVPVGTTILPPTMTMTMGHYMPKWIMVASVLGMMLMLVVTGGSVWMLETTGGGLTAAAEGLVVATQLDECWGDGVLCISNGTCGTCCNGYHPIGVEAYCGPRSNCWDWFGLGQCD